MRKIRIVGLVLALLLACGACLPAYAAQLVPPEQLNKDKTITFWHLVGTPALQDIIKDMCAEFTKEYGVKVDVNNVPFTEFKKQVSIGAAVGQLPDIMMVDVCDMLMYSAMGVYADITDYIQDWDQYKNCLDYMIPTLTYQDHWYGLPFLLNNVGIYYNVDMFKAAGLDPDNPPQSWDELAAAAKKLTTDGVAGMTISLCQSEEGTNNFLPFFWSAGGDIYNFDGEPARKTLNFFKQMIDEGTMPRDVINWTQGDIPSYFLSGKSAIMVLGNWRISALREADPNLNFRCMMIPPDVQHATIIGGNNMAIVNDGDIQEELYLLKYFTTPEKNAAYSQYSGNFPGIKGADANPVYDSMRADPCFSVFLEQYKYAQIRPADVNYPAISAVIQQCIQNALSGSMSVDEAVTLAGQEIDKIAKK